MRSAPAQNSSNRCSRFEAGAESVSTARPATLTPEFLWRAPGGDLALGKGEIHIWHAQLEEQAGHLPRLSAMLDVDERVRAGRFHFDKDRRQFIIRRGLLRMILGRYLRVEPARLRFDYGVHGKPFLLFPGQPRLHFNLSHSDGLALYVVGWNCELGIDVERLREIDEADQIAAHFFSAREHAEWRSLPPGERARAFLEYWTRKEAYLKATGTGIGAAMDQPVRGSTGEQGSRSAGALRNDGNPGTQFLCDLTPVPGYVAALAGISTGFRS